MKKDTNNKRFWDRNASLYDASRRGEKAAYDSMIDRIRALLTPDMNVLELATATGIIALRVADCCKQIEATDFSEEMIKIANGKEKPENVSFSIADATDFKYYDNQFDAVIISNALHIMPNPEKALANIKRVLKDDGLLIAPTYMRSNHLSEKLKVFIGFLIGFKTYSKWTEKEYLAFLAKNGWRVQNCEVFKATFPLAFVSAKCYEMKQVFPSSHEQHIEILNKIKPFTKFVEIVIPYGDSPNDELILSLRPFLIERKKVHEWAGTISGGKASTLYRYSSSDYLFQRLNELESFFTSLDYNDIAFFDENNDVIFYTTTHERYAVINEKLPS